MKRNENWPSLLGEAIKARRSTPFAYGSHDCSIAAADLIEAMTGTDLMADFRGQYKSAASAARALQSIGKGTLLKTLISLVPAHGGRRIPVGQARKGDLVLTKEALHDAVLGQAAGVWLDNTAIFPGERGWMHLPRRALSAAFLIG